MATSVKYPQSYIASDWGDEDHLYADDGDYATAEPLQNGTITGFWYNFDFAIPAGSGIVGQISIEVQWKLSTTASIHTFGIQAYHGATAMGTEDTTTTEPTTDTVRTKSTLNGSWFVDWLNDNTTDGFRVRLRSTRGNDADGVTCSVDYIKVTVTYNAPPKAQTETETPPVDAVGTAALVSVQTDHLSDVVQASGTAELVEIIEAGNAVGTAELMVYVDITKAFLHDFSGSFTDETVDANEDTADDVNLLPASIGANDAFYYLAGFYGASSPKRFGLFVNVTTAGIGTYTLAWEYYNGASWVSLDDYIITFGSIIDYKTAGINKIDIAEPSDISDVTINNVIAKWIRARYVSGTVTTQPKAGRIKVYEVADFEVDVTEYVYAGNIPLSLLPDAPIATIIRVYAYAGDIPLSLLPSYTSIVDAVYAGNIPLSLLPSYASIVEAVYVGNIPLVLLNSITTIVDAVYAGNIPLVLMPSYLSASEYVYAGNIPLVLLPDSPLGIVDSVFAGNIPLILMPSIVAVMEYSPTTGLQLVLMPSYQSIVDKAYVGDIPLVLLPNIDQGLIIERVIIGNIPLILLPTQPRAIVEIDTSGLNLNIPLVLLPDSPIGSVVDTNAVIVLLSARKPILNFTAEKPDCNLSAKKPTVIFYPKGRNI